ncbi:MAG: type I DNA topoisomerase [Bdellovibrio sp.]|nr:type I DNA topoisomerase [Bdellovibrio sp.]
MMLKKGLIIVESPSKAKTIQKYLGREYTVKASVGHIKDLPKSKLGVDVKKGFKVDYQIIPSKVKIINELQKAAQITKDLYLATDPDREGEAIAWHISEELKGKGKKIHRVLINAITKPNVLEAIRNPKELDQQKYHAQQARRILDRLVGYKISPLLWDKVRRGLSAGRVQSVAVKFVVEREREIKSFIPEEYWEIEGLFRKDNNEIETKCFKINEKDPELKDQAQVEKFLASIKSSTWKIKSVEQKERLRRPTPPFITSRLQQEAARKLGFSAKKTMTLAQVLYEGIDLGDFGTQGLITYMRTDSVRIEPSALQNVRDFIKNNYGNEYLPEEAIIYKTKKGAQDAHEAIRPASLEFAPDKIENFLEKDLFRLYQLIWNRFIASQMSPAIYDQTIIDVETRNSENIAVVFRAAGSVMKFPGFTVVYIESLEDEKLNSDQDKILTLPFLQAGDTVEAKKITPSQHFTEPPPHYSDASLIRELEEKGIGRPSTYAAILSNIQDREYVEKRENRYYPTELGEVVNDLLQISFPDILNAEFTAEMENELDAIAEGEMDWKKTLTRFWTPFEKTLEKAKIQMKNLKVQEIKTKIDCEKCGNKMVIKWGKLGSFLACPQYPECNNTQDFKKDEVGEIKIIPKEYTDKKCTKCGNPMVVKSGKFGKFLACSDYPNCKSTAPMTLGIACPTCKVGELAQRQSRFRKIFYSCNRYPDCKFALWDKPVLKSCPQCQFPILTEKLTKKQGLIHRCPQKECGYIEIIEAQAA